MLWVPLGRETPCGKGWRSQESISWRRKNTKFRQNKVEKKRKKVEEEEQTKHCPNSPFSSSISFYPSLFPPLSSSLPFPPSFSLPLPLTLSLPLPPPSLWLLLAICDLCYKILSYCSRFIIVCFLPWRSWTNSKVCKQSPN